MKIKQIKNKIHENEKRLQKLILEVEKIWEETGLDSKDSSYLVEKTMRFEIARNNVMKVISAFKDVIGDYKELCLELEKLEE